jgi:dienelactone hydrolase
LLLACRPEPVRTPAEAPAKIVRFEGDLRQPNGSALHYLAILAPDPGAPGDYLGTIDIPRQALSGAALGRVVFQAGQRVEFELPISGTPRWVGTFNADGSLSCEFSQGEISRACTMREVRPRTIEPAPPPRRAQTPLPPFPYVTEDVRYENPEAHLTLAGTLSTPTSAGPHPAVLLISDVGSQDRDGTRFRHQPALVLADRLVRAGVAVLRVDDRGVGGSDAGADGMGAPELESDLRASLSFLGSRPEIDARRVGLIGHGFGAALAARASAHGAAVSFSVLLAPAAVPGRELLAERAKLAALAQGSSSVRAEQARQDSLATSAIIESAPDLRHARERLNLLQTGAPERSAAAAQDLEVLLALAASPGFRDFLRDDPTANLRLVRCPVLALVPGLDREIPPDQNLAPLGAALAAVRDARLEVLPGLNHAFQTAETGAVSEYDAIEETFAPVALEQVASWIIQRVQAVQH